ncbi:hypothetical protein DEIPH_ctg026orf0053 [Deinococcus phoenicis]|uniref:Polysaccharide biosynthesis protein n=1 Tax=Deinococcus phoenicis TaxID=1476583 RepID=A0A016QQX1_9DEIO|nr:oligosaccharide flippase family protein [Deinococcus phoenicis]EYB68149.1 hypothetical protein DEIPH_ctg026orf0053 [Deinococcus phoenicis]
MSAWGAPLKRLLPRSRFARSVALLAGGTAVGQAISILASPLLTRLYLPGDFGLLALYASLLSVLLPSISLQYQEAIPLPAEEEDALHLLALSLVTLLVLSGLVGLIILLFGGPLVRWANLPALRPYLWLLPVGLIFAGTYQVMSLWVLRQQLFPALARTRVQQGLSALVTQALLGLLHAGPWGLLTGDIVGRTSGVLSLWRSAVPRRFLHGLNVAGMVRMAVRYRRFPLVSSVSALFNGIGLHYPPIIFAALYGSQTVGWLFLTERVLGLPMNVIGNAIGNVFFGQAAQLVHQDPQALARLHASLTFKLLLLSALPTLAIMLLAPSVFALVFGESWREAGVYAQILAPAAVFRLMSSPLTSIFTVTERLEMHLWWDVTRFVAVLAPLYLAHALQLSARAAVVGYALGQLLSYLLLVGLSRYVVLRGIKGTKHA